jgi:hypothetical protein
MRADAAPTLPFQIIRDAIRAVADEIGFRLPEKPPVRRGPDADRAPNTELR